MTQLQALKELAEKVDAGIFPSDLTGPQMGFPDVSAAILYDAFSGSLDAAQTLDEDILDNWYGAILNTSTREVEIQPHRKIAYVGWVIGFSDEYAARAWLLAIIKAKISELE